MAIGPYINIARPDHWFKNIFMVPGIFLALFFQPEIAFSEVWTGALIGLIATCIVAS